MQARLVHRSDDTEEAMVKRIEQYKKNVDAIKVCMPCTARAGRSNWRSGPKRGGWGALGGGVLLLRERERDGWVWRRGGLRESGRAGVL